MAWGDDTIGRALDHWSQDPGFVSSCRLAPGDNGGEIKAIFLKSLKVNPKYKLLN